MKNGALIRLLVLLSIACSVNQVQAQNSTDMRDSRPRKVSGASQPAADLQVFERSSTSSEEQRSGSTRVAGTEAAVDDERFADLPAAGVRQLSPPWVRARIAEAERLLKSKPLQTAMTSPSIEFVTLAALDRVNTRMHLLTVPKKTFLTKGAELTLTSSLGAQLNLRVVRANGVNTAVDIRDGTGDSFVPLVVEFPIEKRGVFREMAYYTSAHPAILTPELARAGRAYVRTMVDLAAKRLSEKGVTISPQIVDVAERLCLVEHVDHDRFRLENRLALFDEIYSLYALNELDTYRYSVSFAGAGGMVQMIPWAYNLMRQRHPGVGLTPDFVTGMRNHGNALQAMLLYMQDTWNDLAQSEDVQYALNEKLATQAELLAAGYNSNAARLSSYIRRGGSDWRTLIPRETQVYLQILKTLEGLVPAKPRARANE
ncbi:MAG TPA: hypothetical protein VJ124_23990 [Pyrinomonadaceae bacterium]|nr:hypothetical protein [Pyrinomonadaceae bacterium]